MPLILAGATSGSTTLQATDAVTATITLPNATDTLVGKTTPSFTTTIGVGNAIPSASGAGITFPATQSASTDANTLDDYEEGTWTPTFTSYSGSITAGTCYGTYTKVGRLVTISFSCTVSNPGTGSVLLLVGNVPFTPNTTVTSYYTGSAINQQSQGGLYVAWFAGGGSFALGTSTYTYPSVGAGSAFHGTITYII